MEELRKKSLLLTGYLEYLLQTEIGPDMVTIFTPADPTQRGCQLSVKFLKHNVEIVNKMLYKEGVICDVRKPDVMRVSPAPIYNSFHDVYLFIQRLKSVLSQLESVCENNTI